jgi:hypothetical protein
MGRGQRTGTMGRWVNPEGLESRPRSVNAFARARVMARVCPPIQSQNADNPLASPVSTLYNVFARNTHPVVSYVMEDRVDVRPEEPRRRHCATPQQENTS